MYIMDIANGDKEIPSAEAANKLAWYLKKLMDITVDGVVELDDVTAVIDLANGDKEI